MKVTWPKVRWALAAGLLLAGCKLIDQTTFAPSPEEPAAKPAGRNADARIPLLTIGYAAPAPEYQEVLRYAVRQAEKRAPGVQYDVTAALPAGGDAAAAQGRATEVMRDIMAQGVPASRVHLALRTVEAADAQDVRVYVR
jgi:hypothetical protein